MILSSAADGREERVVELRELLHRVEEVRQVEMNANSVPIVIVAVEDELAAVAEHDRDRDRGEEVDEREVQPVQHDRLLVRLPVVVVDPSKLALRSALARERLDDAHAGDVLREGRR